MTTSNSPIAALKKQSDNIARMMKLAEEGKLADPTGKVAGARANNPTFKTAIAMDDKLLTIEMTWAQIRETSTEALSEWIVGHMQGSADAPN